MDGEAARAVRSLVGDFRVVGEHRADSDRTAVSEIAAGGERLFVKVHGRLSHWHPEVFAYRSWTGRVAPQAPVMRGAFCEGDVFGIVVTALPGRTVNEAGMADGARLARVYRDAGRLFRRMQGGPAGGFFGVPREDGTPFDGDGVVDPERYVCDALEGIFAAGRDLGLFGAEHAALVRRCLGNAGVFRGDLPTYTNWDFSQNNWMVDDRGEFAGFIDFEHTRWGLPLDSFGVILERYTADRPALRAAFFEGYGLNGDEETREKLFFLSVKMAMADVVGGFSHGHSRFLACGRRMLERLVAGEGGR